MTQMTKKMDEMVLKIFVLGIFLGMCFGLLLASFSHIYIFRKTVECIGNIVE